MSYHRAWWHMVVIYLSPAPSFQNFLSESVSNILQDFWGSYCHSNIPGLSSQGVLWQPCTLARGWQNVDPEPRVGGGGSGQRLKKKIVTPTILMADNNNGDPEDLTRPILPSISASQSDATLKGDLEDTILGKSPHRPILSEVLIDGKFVSKLVAALCWLLLHQLNCASTDHLPQIQKVSCFNSSARALPLDRDNMVHDSDLGEPCLQVGNPAATLLRCKEQVFLVLVNITGLKHPHL